MRNPHPLGPSTGSAVQIVVWRAVWDTDLSPLRVDSALQVHGGAVAYGFPRGEAVMKSRSSQRLFMTEEEWRNASIMYAKTVKRLGNKDFLLCLLIYTGCLSFHVAVPHPTRLRRATFPPGEGMERRKRQCDMLQFIPQPKKPGVPLARPVCLLFGKITAFPRRPFPSYGSGHRLRPYRSRGEHCLSGTG